MRHLVLPRVMSPEAMLAGTEDYRLANKTNLGMKSWKEVILPRIFSVLLLSA